MPCLPLSCLYPHSRLGSCMVSRLWAHVFFRYWPRQACYWIRLVLLLNKWTYLCCGGDAKWLQILWV